MKKILIVFTITSILVSCNEKNELNDLPVNLAENEEFTVSSDTIFFSSDDINKMYFNYNDLLNDIKDKPYYENVLNKINGFNSELKYIEKNKLYLLEEDNEFVKSYCKKFDNKLKSTDAAIGALYHDNDMKGGIVAYTGVSNPRYRKKNRNKASSWQGLPTFFTVVLCDKTWFRGSKKIIVANNSQVKNLTDFNDRTESHY